MPIEVRGLAPLFQVYDMPTSIHFYSDLLGFEVVQHAPEYAPGRFHWALLRLNGVELMLNTKYEFDDQRPPKLIEEHDFGPFSAVRMWTPPTATSAKRESKRRSHTSRRTV